jgi:hypothetical protein
MRRVDLALGAVVEREAEAVVADQFDCSHVW